MNFRDPSGEIVLGAGGALLASGLVKGAAITALLAHLIAEFGGLWQCGESLSPHTGDPEKLTWPSRAGNGDTQGSARTNHEESTPTPETPQDPATIPDDLQDILDNLSPDIDFGPRTPQHGLPIRG
jgi:hypothetical protein